MFVKIDLYSGESSIVEYCEELREELNSCEYYYEELHSDTISTKVLNASG